MIENSIIGNHNVETQQDYLAGFDLFKETAFIGEQVVIEKSPTVMQYDPCFWTDDHDAYLGSMGNLISFTAEAALVEFPDGTVKEFPYYSLTFNREDLDYSHFIKLLYDCGYVIQSDVLKFEDHYLFDIKIIGIGVSLNHSLLVPIGKFNFAQARYNLAKQTLRMIVDKAGVQ